MNAFNCVHCTHLTLFTDKDETTTCTGCQLQYYNIDNRWLCESGHFVYEVFENIYNPEPHNAQAEFRCPHCNTIMQLRDPDDLESDWMDCLRCQSRYPMSELVHIGSIMRLEGL